MQKIGEIVEVVMRKLGMSRKQVICAWCEKVMGEKFMQEPKENYLRGWNTHGICEDCKKRFFPNRT